MPDNEWAPPKAPNLREDFNRASQGIDETRTDEIPRETVTLDEQKALEAQRDALVLEQHYTMDGPIGEAVNREEHERLQQLETRINYIRERREAAQQKLRENFKNRSRNSTDRDR